jgi:REP element-mobilizing transposase RayT
MSNKPRVEEPGAHYHVNANGLDDLVLFRDDLDRTRFLDLLAEEVERSEWTILEYTLLSTHYHLLLQLKEPTLSAGFQRLQSRYARGYNRRRGRRGCVWLKRFDDVMIESESHLFEVTRYIALNAPRRTGHGARTGPRLGRIHPIRSSTNKPCSRCFRRTAREPASGSGSSWKRGIRGCGCAWRSSEPAQSKLRRLGVRPRPREGGPRRHEATA